MMTYNVMLLLLLLLLLLYVVVVVVVGLTDQLSFFADSVIREVIAAAEQLSS